MSDERPKPETDKPPLKDPKIDVAVTPKKGATPEDTKRNKDDAKRLEPKIKEAVKDAVEKAAPDGRKAQREAQKKAGDDAAQQIPAHKIEEIKITVSGNKTSHKPNEGGPPPDPPASPAEKKLTLTRGW